jgi:hypothetical protein
VIIIIIIILIQHTLLRDVAVQDEASVIEPSQRVFVNLVPDL